MDHPAIDELRRIQAEWQRTGIKDPRIDAYILAMKKARQAGLDEDAAVLFSAKAVTGQ